MALTENNCHTYDRLNLEAQRDCGVGNKIKNATAISIFKRAADYAFQLKYWQFTRSLTGYNCMNGIFPASRANIYASSVINLNTSLLALLFLGVTLQLAYLF